MKARIIQRLFLAVLIKDDSRSVQLLFIKINVKQSQYKTGQTQGLQEVEGPRSSDDLHVKAVRVSALSTRRVYPP